ncbi:hypothetical protein [Acetobacterium wieringae]|uniref:hypothetical protein n=1 Tax=Acetobacterium wieringae TaxID=52694 RepID=UPI0026E937F9|nr:hypothetical protein [Acetobacterium wieringae]
MGLILSLISFFDALILVVTGILGVDQVSQVVQGNTATAEQSAAASEELSGQSQLLKEMISRFKLKR